MNEDRGDAAQTLPFARPTRGAAGGRGGAKFGGDMDAELLDIVKQEPEMNISRTILLSKQIGAGRYQVDAARVARKMLQFEDMLQRDQDSGGRSSASSGKSSASSTSQDDSSS